MVLAILTVDHPSSHTFTLLSILPRIFDPSLNSRCPLQHLPPLHLPFHLFHPKTHSLPKKKSLPKSFKPQNPHCNRVFAPSAQEVSEVSAQSLSVTPLISSKSGYRQRRRGYIQEPLMWSGRPWPGKGW